MVTGGPGLAAHGAAVGVAEIDESAAEHLARPITDEQGGKALPVKCDVGDADSVEAMVDRVARELGAIDILDNNAAKKCENLAAYFAPYEDYSPTAWCDIIDVDGVFLVSQATGRRMVTRGQGGSIIQTSSIYGFVAQDQRIYEGSEYPGVTISLALVYAASKAAVIGLSNYLATYWGGQNETFTEKYSAKVPLDRMAKGDEMIGALVFLALNTSSYVTGQTLAVDGGFSTW